MAKHLSPTSALKAFDSSLITHPSFLFVSHQDGDDFSARADTGLVTAGRAFMQDIVQALHLTYEGGKLGSLRTGGMLRMAGLLREMVCVCERAHMRVW